jgi:hypothetical protein
MAHGLAGPSNSEVTETLVQQLVGHQRGALSNHGQSGSTSMVADASAHDGRHCSLWSSCEEPVCLGEPVITNTMAEIVEALCQGSTMDFSGRLGARCNLEVNVGVCIHGQVRGNKDDRRSQKCTPAMGEVILAI